MGHGQHHSSGESHRHQRDRHHKHKHRPHGEVPVGRPYAPPNGQPVVGKLVEPAPHGSDWPPRKHRRRGSNRFWTTTSAITTFAFVIFAVGCMAGGWLLMRSVLGNRDAAKTTTKDTGTQVAAKGDSAKSETPTQPKATEQVKATVPETKAAPPPETKPVTRPPETKAETPKPPPETKPVTKPPEPPKPDEAKPPDPSVPLVFFDKDILPVFQVKCNRCHGDGKIKGKLDMRTMAAIMKGGENGAALDPRNFEKGTIYVEVFKEKSMPPKGEPALTDDQKKLIENWIKGGGKATAVAGGPAPAPPPARGGAVLAYEKDVLPILTAKCGKCHDSTSLKAGVDVTSLAALKKGGNSGFPAIVAGDLKKSELWQQIDLGTMPQEGSPKLTPAEIEKIKNWIMMGAKDNKAAMVAAK